LHTRHILGSSVFHAMVAVTDSIETPTEFVVECILQLTKIEDISTLRKWLQNIALLRGNDDDLSLIETFI
jgi:hypothetical protein